MGNSYTHLATQDPSELLPPSAAIGTDISKLQKWTTRFTSTNHTSRFSNEIIVIWPSVDPENLYNLIIHSIQKYITCKDINPIIHAPVHSDAIGALAPVRPGIVLSGGRDKLIALNNIDTGKCILRWYGHEKEVTKIAYRNSFAKHFILSGSRDSQIRLWQFDSPNTLRIFSGHQMSIGGLAMVDQTKFISGARDATLRLWDLETGACLCAARHSRNLVVICFSLNLGQLQSLSCVSVPNEKSHTYTLRFLPDGNYCITSSNGFNGDGCEITLWDIRQQKMMLEYHGHEESQVTSKRMLLSVSADHTARLWNVDDGSCLWSELIPTASDLLACVGFRDGNIVVSGLNATFCHLRILSRAARPYLECISAQSHARYSISP
ncbi:WD repeat-containing protein 31 [Dirofilaria immitis]|nr:WD repeat-containing protein 31 [Dirofilaria immitis]